MPYRFVSAKESVILLHNPGFYLLHLRQRDGKGFGASISIYLNVECWYIHSDGAFFLKGHIWRAIKLDFPANNFQMHNLQQNKETKQILKSNCWRLNQWFQTFLLLLSLFLFIFSPPAPLHSQSPLIRARTKRGDPFCPVYLKRYQTPTTQCHTQAVGSTLFILSGF